MPLLAAQLASFLTVATTGNISAAAKRLHLTQPAVTKHVRALERMFGQPLLERTARGVRLTEAGQLLRDYGQRSATLLDECRTVLHDLTSGRTGSLAIGAGVTTSIFQLPRWLRLYRRRWPDVDIRIQTGESRVVAELVRTRAIDCGFVTSPIKHAQLVSRTLYSETISLVVSPKANFPEQVTLEQVPLIMFPAHAGFRRYLERAFAAAGLDPQLKMEIDSVEATKSLVELGLGGAFLPETAVQRELKHGRLRKLSVRGLPKLSRQTRLIQHADRRPSRALLNFVSTLDASGTENVSI